MTSYTYTTLDDPSAGSVGTFAVGITNEGQITGYYFDSNGAAHGFLYSGGTWTTLNDPFATNGTFAEGINNKGQIVGYYVDATGDHGFLYSGGTYTTLNDTAANSGTTQAFGINDLGQIVGGFTDANGDHGFLYSGGSYTTLDAGPSAPAGYYGTSPFVTTYYPATGTVAYAINDAGQIVGQNTFLMYNVSILTIASEGFLYTDGTSTTVNPPWDFVKPLADTVLSSYAGGINGLGQIVGGPGFTPAQGPSFVSSFNSYTALDDPEAVNHETNPFGINPTKQLRPGRVHRMEPFGYCVLSLEGSRGPARSNAGRGSRFVNAGRQRIYRSANGDRWLLAHDPNTGG
jgi:probable HAF family extracellular repeat protein